MNGLAWVGDQLAYSPKGAIIIKHRSESFLVFDVKSKHHVYPLLMELTDFVLSKIH